MREQFDALETEGRNPRTMNLDALDTRAMVGLLHSENQFAIDAVERILEQVAAVIDLIADRLQKGGRLFYVGAGTSGRLGVLDASECPPTFGVASDLVQGIIAGGNIALTSSIEGAEDSPKEGSADLMARDISASDIVVGIAASGRTPYVIGALDLAHEVGACTVALVNVSNSALSHHADITLAPITGPEPLTGSTRLKAGTSQKLVLNLLTTGAMVRLGKTYGNLMVDVVATNSKLMDRAVRIVMAGANSDRKVAEESLKESEGSAKCAIVMLLAGVSATEAFERLERAGGWVSRAISQSKED